MSIEACIRSCEDWLDKFDQSKKFIISINERALNFDVVNNDIKRYKEFYFNLVENKINTLEQNGFITVSSLIKKDIEQFNLNNFILKYIDLIEESKSKIQDFKTEMSNVDYKNKSGLYKTAIGSQYMAKFVSNLRGNLIILYGFFAYFVLLFLCSDEKYFKQAILFPILKDNNPESQLNKMIDAANLLSNIFSSPVGYDLNYYPKAEQVYKGLISNTNVYVREYNQITTHAGQLNLALITAVLDAAEEYSGSRSIDECIKKWRGYINFDYNKADDNYTLILDKTFSEKRDDELISYINQGILEKVYKDKIFSSKSEDLLVKNLKKISDIEVVRDSKKSPFRIKKKSYSRDNIKGSNIPPQDKLLPILVNFNKNFQQAIQADIQDNSDKKDLTDKQVIKLKAIIECLNYRLNRTDYKKNKFFSNTQLSMERINLIRDTLARLNFYLFRMEEYPLNDFKTVGETINSYINNLRNKNSRIQRIYGGIFDKQGGLQKLLNTFRIDQESEIGHFTAKMGH